MSLRDEVARFHAWAAERYPESPPDGWQNEYAGWDALYSAVEAFLIDAPLQSWNEQDVADLLEVLAHDEATEYIANLLADRPQALLKLAAKASEGKADARWQIASRLGRLDDLRDEARQALLRLADDPDEYVSRRALLALAELRAPEAERLAERAWETGHEYQRIAALYVLRDMASGKLATYVGLALEDGREKLVMNAQKLDPR